MRILICALALALTGCSGNVRYVKAHATERWAELGYTVIAYEGYNWSICGGNVWYSLKRLDSPGAVYTGALCKWGDELQVYGPTVVSGDLRGLQK